MGRWRSLRRRLVPLALGVPMVALPANASTGARRPLPLDVEGVVERSLALARQELQSEQCRAIYRDFSDAEGRPLARRLERIGVSGSDHLAHLRWINGAGHPTCRDRSVLLATLVGSLRVQVCPRQFAEYAAREPRKAAGLVLHEQLHSLGLGENPPTSAQITRQVWTRCGR